MVSKNFSGVLNGATQVFGVIGDPIRHSLSPAMQNAALKALGRDCVYVPFRVEPQNLETSLEGLRALNVQGINVTIPHKVEVMKYLDKIDPMASFVGAVNTVFNTDEGLVGYNTDGIGFLRSLQEEAGKEPHGQAITILGAGGAARAIGFQLAASNAKTIVIANRTAAKARALACDIRVHTHCEVFGVGLHELDLHLPTTDILINTTSLGMYPHVESSPPAQFALLSCKALVCDIVYNPAETLFLKKARAEGLATLTGLGMLAYQGAASLEIWLGEQAPVDTMKLVLARQLGHSDGGFPLDAFD